MIRRIKDLIAKRREQNSFRKFVLSKSIPNCERYFSNLDLSKQVTLEEIKSFIRPWFKQHFNESDVAFNEFMRICNIGDCWEQQRAFKEFDSRYSKSTFNKDALLQINGLNDLLYSLIVHQDMCCWIDEKCEHCGGKMIKMVYNTPPYAWKSLYGRRSSQFLCTECMKTKSVELMIMS